jgi:hypothetical protein
LAAWCGLAYSYDVIMVRSRSDALNLGSLRNRNVLIIPGIVSLLSLAAYTLWYLAADTILVGGTSGAPQVSRVVIDNIGLRGGNFSGNVALNNKHKTASTIRLWFFSIHPGMDMVQKIYLKQAIISAKQKTSLIPIVLVEASNADMEEWVQSIGGCIIHISESIHKSKLLQIVSTNKDFEQNVVAWHKLLLPQIIADNHETIMESDKRIRLEDFRYVLYTDPDVLFLNDFDLETQLLPRYVGMAVQGNIFCCAADKFSGQIQSSTGVVVMNVTGYAEAQREFHSFLVSKANEYKPSMKGRKYNDLNALHDFFPLRFEKLSLADYASLVCYHGKYFASLRTKYYATRLPKAFEWEPYLGVNKDANILHWQGSHINVTTCDDFRKAAQPTKTAEQQGNTHANSTAQSKEMLLKKNIIRYLPPSVKLSTATALDGYSFATDLYSRYMDIICSPKKLEELKQQSTSKT